MRKLFTFLLLIGIILSFLNGCSSSNDGDLTFKEGKLSTKSVLPVDFFPKELKVVSIGDSLTEGVGDETKSGGYIPYLQKDLEKEKMFSTVEFSNFGVKGNRSSQILKRLDGPEVRAAIKEADMVILTVGGNDMMKVVRENFTNLKLQSFEDAKIGFKNNLRQIVTTIRAENKDAVIVLIGLYNPFSKWFSNVKQMDQILHEWNMMSKFILEEYDSTFFVDIEDIFQNKEEDLLYTDYFHPNNKGYELIAGHVYERINDQAFTIIAQKE